MLSWGRCLQEFSFSSPQNPQGPADDLQELAFNENKRGKATARMPGPPVIKVYPEELQPAEWKKLGKKNKLKITGLLFKEKKSPEPFSERLAVVRGVNS